MQSQISWLLQKPTDLNLHCLQRQGISGFRRTRVNIGKPKLGTLLVLNFQQGHFTAYQCVLNCWMSGKQCKLIGHHLQQCLIWVYTVCSGLSVPIFEGFSVFLYQNICCEYSLEMFQQFDLFMMDNHRVCFLWRNKKGISTFWLEKKQQQQVVYIISNKCSKLYAKH